jgi:outer membrane protein assembly factor BamB
MRKHWHVTCALALLVVVSGRLAAAPSADQVKTLSPGGLVVSAGDPSPALVLGVVKEGRWLALHLVADEAQRESARKEVNTAGLQGHVRVEVLGPNTRVPLADHMANAVIVSNNAINRDEVLRILSPGRGKAWLNGQELTKPMPRNFGEWTHWNGDAQGTDTSPETGMQVPNSLRWIAGPWYGDGSGGNGWRLHGGLAASEWNLPGIDNMRSEGSVITETRDAFNGIIQWRRQHNGIGDQKTKPTMFANGMYIVPDESIPGQPYAAYDGLTGKKLRVFEGMPTTDVRGSRLREIGAVVADGKLYQTTELQARCIELSSGKVLWSFDHNQGDFLARPIIAPDLGLLIMIESVQYQHRGLFAGRYPMARCQALIAFHRDTGKLAWRLPLDPAMADLKLAFPNLDWNKRGAESDASRIHTLTYTDGRVFALNANDANGGKPGAVWAVDAKAGKSLWVAICGPDATNSMFDLFPLADGSLLTYGHTWARLDQKTGKLLGHGTLGGNGRCDTGTATADMITAGFGNFFRLREGELERTRHSIVRAQCGGYSTPGYGATYSHASGCGCFHPIRGILALHHEPLPKPIPDGQRLTRGPAFARPLAPSSSAASDWPQFMANGGRLAGIKASGPAALTQAWSVKLAEPLEATSTGVKEDWRIAAINNGPVLAPVIAGDTVVTAERDAHTVIALDAKTGKEKWRFVADGRIMNPPTLWQNRVIFGTRGGRVFNLDVATGELAWTFFAAPEQRYLVSYGQLESSFPLHGSLPIVDGIVVASAGYHGETDGGVWVWGLDARTGAIKWKRQFYNEPLPWVAATERNPARTSPLLRSNGGYDVSKVLNIDLPVVSGGNVRVAQIWLDAQTGEPSSDGEADYMNFRELEPFFNSRTERRGGPHGGGGWTMRVGDQTIGDFRGGANKVRYVRTDGDIYTVLTNDPRKRDGKLLAIDPGKMKYNRLSEIRDFPPVSIIASDEVRALALADKRVYAAGAKTITSYTGPYPGWLNVTAIDAGNTDSIDLDAAAIDNGIAIANGKLYVTCTDGTIRCFDSK